MGIAPWIFCIIGFVLLVLYDLLQLAGFGLAKNLDELFCAVLLAAVCVAVPLRGRVRLLPFEKRILLAAVLLMAVGLWPYLAAPPNSYKAILFDVVVFYKFLAAYFGARILCSHWQVLRWRTVIVSWHVGLAVIIGLVLLVNKISPVFPQVDPRFGVWSEQLFFGHPSRYAFFWIYMFVVLMPFLLPNHRWFLLLVMVAGSFSLRVKYFGFLPLGLAAIWLGDRFRRIDWRSPWVLGLGLGLAMLVICIAWPKIVFYFSYESLDLGLARAVLLHNAFEVANTNFPVGSGFGTYGSWASGLYYSPLYFSLEMDRVYGLSPAKYNFVADTYWPMVLGQFGYVGVMLVGWILLDIAWHFLRLYNEASYRKEKCLYLSGLVLLAALLMDSSSDAIFTHNSAVMAFFYLALMVNQAVASARSQMKISIPINTF